MSVRFEAGDILVYQLEAGFALIRVLRVDGSEDPVWHIAAYDDFFFEIDAAERAIEDGKLLPSKPHIALTNRAFESTQVAKLAHAAVTEAETATLAAWDGEVSDRSVRLMLGFR